MTDTRGRFIALEGIDGSGTTTQAQALAQALADQGVTCLVTNEPSSGSIGTAIREQLRVRDGAKLPGPALALMFAADRLDHVANEIEPALDAGRWVVCDRYVMSSWAYQSTECDPKWVREINARAPWPDRTLVLHVPVDVALQRVGARGEPVERYETRTRLTAVADRYEAILAEGLPGVIRVDGARPAAAVSADLLAFCLPLQPGAH